MQNKLLPEHTARQTTLVVARLSSAEGCDDVTLDEKAEEKKP
jgi:hypothetical protein